MEPLTFLWVHSFRSSSCAFASYHHASAGFYLLKVLRKHLFYFFRVCCKHILPAGNPCRPSAHKRLKNCVARTPAVGGGWLPFLSPFQAAAISPVLFWSPKRGVSACLNVTDCAKAASQTQQVIKKYHRGCSNRSADCLLSPRPGVKAGTAKQPPRLLHDTAQKRGLFSPLVLALQTLQILHSSKYSALLR